MTNSESKVKTEKDSRQDKINNNLGLVHACAKKFVGKGIEYDDLYSTGCVGLVKAVDNFDESRGFKFSTYAVPVILGEIKRLFRDGGLVKVSRRLKEVSLKIGRESDAFKTKHNREPTVNELADILNEPCDIIIDAISSARYPVSLTVENDEGDERQLDLKTPSHEENLTEILSLEQVLKDLNDIDRQLIELRFFKNKTQSVTAKELGISQVQVSRKEKKILLSLRQKLTVP